MNHRKSKMGQSRDLGMTSNGKGDASRVTDKATFDSNFDLINWGRKPKPPADYVENEAEWPDVIGVGPSATPITHDLDPE